ncbi:MAG: hypothetical protein H8E66_21865 [Planctomycetes bacterium]|nr:hypothetical protein [Planctomycetota bacterium]
MNRFLTWFFSAAGVFGVPLGSWWCRRIEHLQTAERHERGLVLILPGVEGYGSVNLSIARGLEDGRFPGAVEIVDWTTGWFALSLYHLRSRAIHDRGAVAIAERLQTYWAEYPDRPTFLIGHSGGGAVLLKALEALPITSQLTSAILLHVAVSPKYNFTNALARVERSMWNYHSSYDLFQLGIGTLIFGTADRRHCLAAGNRGFDVEKTDTDGEDRKLIQVPYRRSMIASGNLPGHCGCTNRLFVSEWIAPLIRACDRG